jgi:methionyl-tRNA synthetase
MPHSRRLLVTSALPYANGAIHLGHLVEYLQTDIWVRFQKMRGHEVHYVCADDTHGTAIMLRAEKEGITPEQLIARVRDEHLRDFTGFHIAFDHYGSTHDAQTRAVVEDIYRKLRDDAQRITTRPVEQFFDPVKSLFLPDRFIKGTCPKCGAKDQYGDACEVCGSTYNPTDLIDPYSTVSGATPVRRTSDHWFFQLGRCEDFLRSFTQDARADGSWFLEQPEARNKIREWFDAGLTDWDISRDAPYFGFEIPDAPGKYFYVWLDAPIGYLGSFRHVCDRPGGPDFADFTDPARAQAAGTEMVHFIGKDILYFHALFWPATLHFAGYRPPTHVYAHGFLTVNGEKMSKSRGTFITARSWLDVGLDPEWLRYYYAAKLNASMEDLDLNLDDFVARVNSDLVGKFVNIASRSAKFIAERFEGKLHKVEPGQWLGGFLPRRDALDQIAAHYEARDFGKAMREIMFVADRVNMYVDSVAPWQMAKLADKEERLHEVCSEFLDYFRFLTIALSPVLPALAAKAREFLSDPSMVRWDAAKEPLPAGHRINAYEHLMTRVDPKRIAALVEANRDNLPPAAAAPTAVAASTPESPAVTDTPPATASTAAPTPAPATSPVAPIAPTITIDDFAKLDLRVARVAEAHAVEGADKLVKLVLDLGGEQRQVFAGIKAHYTPERLVGRHVVMVANLAPRKMRFGESQGMVLAASFDGDAGGVFLIDVDAGAQPGMRVK